MDSDIGLPAVAVYIPLGREGARGLARTGSNHRTARPEGISAEGMLK